MSTRRTFLGGALGTCVLATSACARDADLARGGRVPSSATSQRSTATAPGSAGAPSQQPSSPSRAEARASALSLDQQVGQLFMVGHSSSSLGGARSQVEEHQLGWLLLLGDQIQGRSQVAVLASELSSLSLPVPAGLAADQEGGRIQRLKGSGFSTIPSAVEQARIAPADLTAKWAAWGTELHRAGVRFNLAPVADVVPEDLVARNAPVGQLHRHYGTGAMAAGDLAAAAIAGMTKARVASSVKHFPGLGKVTTNTDFGEAVDERTTANDPDLRAFRTAIGARPSSVMVSSAIYRRIDRNNQAAFSSRIIEGMLRKQFGWSGVVISDDLGAAASVQHIPAGQRALRFLRAGGDIVINADPALTPAMVGAVLDEAKKDTEFAAAVQRKCARAIALKERIG